MMKQNKLNFKLAIFFCSTAENQNINIFQEPSDLAKEKYNHIFTKKSSIDSSSIENPENLKK